MIQLAFTHINLSLALIPNQAISKKSFRALHSAEVITYSQRRLGQRPFYVGAEKRASPGRVRAFQSQRTRDFHVATKPCVRLSPHTAPQ